jgi:HEAT repeat protein
MASCGPTQKETLVQIDKLLAKEPNADVRAQAVLALAQLEDKAKVYQGMRNALRDASPKVRATVAFAIAQRRDAELAKDLEEAVLRESELDTKAWLEAAVAVVRGGDGAPFKNFLERELGEKVPAAGLGGLGGLGGRGGAGRGGPGGG